MAQLTVNSRQMRNTADELSQLNGQLKKEVEALRSNQRSLNAQWEGESNDAFNRSFNRNAAEFDNFSTLINEYVNALRDYAGQYEAMEEKNKRIAPTR